VITKLFWPTLIFILLLGSYQLGTRRHEVTPSPVTPKTIEPLTMPQSDNPEDIARAKLVGPLAVWMQSQEQNGLDGNGESARPAPTYHASDQDRLIHVPVSAPNNFLHSTFSVKDCTAYEIEVPPGMLAASLSGSFESFTVSANHERQSAEIELLLLDATGFRDFVHGKTPSAKYSTEPSAAHAVQWLLDTDYKQSNKYFLVFSNPGHRPKLVKANFTLHFG
jgi:hypothetical protein